MDLFSKKRYEKGSRGANHFRSVNVGHEEHHSVLLGSD